MTGFIQNTSSSNNPDGFIHALESRAMPQAHSESRMSPILWKKKWNPALISWSILIWSHSDIECIVSSNMESNMCTTPVSEWSCSS